MPDHILKLSIELIPETSWYNNLRSLMGKEAWNILRKKVYKDCAYRCGICGDKGKLSCHEIWEFDDINHIQKLAGLTALCELCHAVKHIGLSELRSDKGELEFEKIIEHFIKVNKCKRKDFEKHKEKAVKLFNEQSKHDWKINIGELEV